LRRGIKVPSRAEGHNLTPYKRVEEHGAVVVRIDAINRIVARGGRPAHVQTLVGSESQMIGRNTRFEGREDEGLAVTGNLKDRAAAIANVEIVLAIEGDASRNAHAFGVRRHRPIGCDPVDRTVLSRGNVHLSFPIKGNTVRIHQLREEGLYVIAGINLVDRDRYFLSTRSGEGDEEIAFVIQSGVRDRMKILGDRYCHFQVQGIARGFVGNHDHRTRVCAFGNSSDNKIVGRDDHAAGLVAETDPGSAHLRGSQPSAGYVYFATGKRELWSNRSNMRLSVQAVLSP